MAIGDPSHVPVGVYAVQALKHAKWWPQVRHRVVSAATAADVLRFVETGQCDTGVVYDATARVSTNTSCLGVFPSWSHDPVLFTAACVREGRNGLAFLDFMRTPEAEAILGTYGFQPVSRPNPPEFAQLTPEVSNDKILPAVLLSLRVALVCMLIVMVPGVLLGWVLARKDFTGKSILEAMVLLGTQGLSNTFEVVVADHDLCTGLTLYSVPAQAPSGEPDRLRIKLKGPCQPGHRPGHAYSVSLPSRSIALALAPVDYISMQNQMPGYVTEITDLPGKSAAVVDVGIRLMVEITAQAITDLGLHIGQKVWCLFKASSLELVPKPAAGFPGGTTKAKQRGCTGITLHGHSERVLSHAGRVRRGR